MRFRNTQALGCVDYRRAACDIPSVQRKIATPSRSTPYQCRGVDVKLKCVQAAAIAWVGRRALQAQVCAGCIICTVCVAVVCVVVYLLGGRASKDACPLIELRRKAPYHCPIRVIRWQAPHLRKYIARVTAMITISHRIYLNASYPRVVQST